MTGQKPDSHLLLPKGSESQNIQIRDVSYKVNTIFTRIHAETSTRFSSMK